jgi:hypothetical protein
MKISVTIPRNFEDEFLNLHDAHKDCLLAVGVIAVIFLKFLGAFVCISVLW